MTTILIDLLLTFRSPTIQSIEILQQKFLLGLVVVSIPLVYSPSHPFSFDKCHMILSKKYWIYVFMPSQKNEHLILSYVLWKPKLFIVDYECISSKTHCFQDASSFPRKMHPLYLNIYCFHLYPLGGLGFSQIHWMSCIIVLFAIHLWWVSLNHPIFGKDKVNNDPSSSNCMDRASTTIFDLPFLYIIL